MAITAEKKAQIVDYIKDHPGSLVRDIADFVKLTDAEISSFLFLKLKVKSDDDRLARVEIKSPNGRPAFSWYSASDVPPGVNAETEIRPKVRRGSPKQLAKESPGPAIIIRNEKRSADREIVPKSHLAPVPKRGDKLTTGGIVAYIAANPGVTPREIAENLGWNQNTISSHAFNAFSGKSYRLDRVGAVLPDGAKTFRWYHPDDLPEDVRKQREEMAAQEQASESLAEQMSLEQLQQIHNDLTDAPTIAPADEQKDESTAAEQSATPAEPVLASMAAISQPRPIMDMLPDEGLSAAREIIGNALSVFVSGVVEAAIRGINAQLPAAIALQMERVLQQIPAEQFVTTPAPTEKKTKKQRVLVVGLLPHQANLIEADFGDAIDLDFATADCPSDRLQSKAKHASAIYLVIDKMGHRVTYALNSHKDKTTNVSGGLSSLRHHLKIALAQPH